MAQDQHQEPLFVAVAETNPRMALAHACAAETMDRFRELVQAGEPALYLAKLRFRDPEASEETGEDRFLYLWLDQVVFHAAEGLFSGVFFEVPEELRRYHPIGSRLGFEPEDAFDWMVNADGLVRGGYTLRVQRQGMAEAEWAWFDARIGAESFEPDPFDAALAEV